MRQPQGRPISSDGQGIPCWHADAGRRGSTARHARAMRRRPSRAACSRVSHVELRAAERTRSSVGGCLQDRTCEVLPCDGHRNGTQYGKVRCNAQVARGPTACDAARCGTLNLRQPCGRCNGFESLAHTAGPARTHRRCEPLPRPRFSILSRHDGTMRGLGLTAADHGAAERSLSAARNRARQDVPGDCDSRSVPMANNP